MTTDEITALRKELEDALLTAFNDFHRITGVCVESIDVTTIMTRPIQEPRFFTSVDRVRVNLEGL